MLAYINIENIAVIEKAEIGFYDGLNVLTGETGAGKSIIIDSIGMVLGHRTTKDIIRTGKQKAAVTALFYLKDAFWDKLLEFNIEKTEDNSIILSREISADGRGLCKINDRVCQLSTLKDIGKLLINIHGQQDTAVLYSPEKHIGLLDGWAWDKLEAPMRIYEELYVSYKQLDRKIKELRQNEDSRKREIDILQFQIQEISGLKLKEGEQEELESRISELENSEKISDILKEAHEMLIDSSNNARDTLHYTMRNLSSISDISPELQSIYNEVADLAYRLDDIGYTIDNYSNSMEYNESELDKLNERLYEIRQMCSKYKSGFSGLIEFQEKAQKRLSELTGSSEQLLGFTAEYDKVFEKIKKSAQEISVIRNKCAKILEKEIEKELSELNMPGAKFSILIDEAQNYTSAGKDTVEFLISPNPGEQLKPIAKIASGGELSRIMLALKSIISSFDIVETYIFDEIDTGISGRTAEKVADKLIKVSVQNQTIIITHSPHIAAIADHHYLIDKQVEGGITKTKLVLLDDEGRVNEIARINSGSHLTETAIAHARELLRLRKK